MKEIDIEEAQISLNELIDLAIKGEEVIITQNHQSLVKLAPITLEKQHWPAYFGSAKGEVWIADDFDEPLEEFKDHK